MRVALIIDCSQTNKFEDAFHTLKEVCENYGHTLVNYGMFGQQDKKLSYTHCALLAAILLNAKACDYAVIVCKTGQGATIALNSFPNVVCGCLRDSIEAYYFRKVFPGNAIAVSYDRGYSSDLNLHYCFENIFKDDDRKTEYNKSMYIDSVDREQLEFIKTATTEKMVNILKKIDKDFLLETIDRESFRQYFFRDASDQELSDLLKEELHI